MIGLQSMEANMNTLEVIEHLIRNLPAEWLETNSTGAASLPQLVNISRIIRRIADNINEKEYVTKKMNKNTFG